MKYIFSNFVKEKASMTRMVQKLYPGFDDRKDFCLWLLFDSYEPDLYMCRQANIKALGNGGEELSLLPPRASLLIRHPYPNRNLSQIGVKYGTKRIFGVPLVVTARNSVKKITEIHVDWFSCYGWMGENGYRGKAIHSEYQLDWGLAAEGSGHWFTLCGTDIPPNVGNCFVGEYHPGEPTQEFLAGNVAIQGQPFAHDLFRFLEKSDVVDTVHLECYSRKSEVEMEPCPYADLIPDPTLGFN